MLGGDRGGAIDVGVQHILDDGFLVLAESSRDIGATLVFAHVLKVLELGDVLARIHLRVLRDEIGEG